MQKLTISAKGKPEKVLRLEQVAGPTSPSENSVIVKVAATGLNFMDASACINPSHLVNVGVAGFEFAGTIIKSVIAEWPVGTEVIGWMPRGGALQSEIDIPTKQLVMKPKPLTMAQAAALPISYVAALQLLTRVVGMQRSQRMLVHGGAGALGTALISLGRYLGLEIYTTAEAKFHGQLHLLGASPINYEAEHFLRAVRRLSIDGAHAVFDCLGFTLLRSWDCLRPEGVLVSTGFMQAERSGGAGAGLFTQLNLGMNTVAGRGKKYINYEFEHPQWQHLWHQDLVHVVSIVMSGKVDLAIAPSISPKKVPAFLSDMLQYKTPMGKTAVLWDAE